MRSFLKRFSMGRILLICTCLGGYVSSSSAIDLSQMKTLLRPDGKSSNSEDWADDSYTYVNEVVVAPDNASLDGNCALADRFDGSEAELIYTFSNPNSNDFPGPIDRVRVYFHASRYKNVGPLVVTLYVNGSAVTANSYTLPSGHDCEDGDWFVLTYDNSLTFTQANSLEVGFLAPELVTSMEIYLGAVYIEVGTFLDSTNADFLIYGEYAEDRAGYDLSSIGDTNGDGKEDFIIDSHYKNSPNYVGPAENAIFFGRTTSFPSSVAGADGATRWTSWVENGYHSYGVGDINDDGYDDFMVGGHDWSIPSATVHVGVCYLVMGHSGTFPSDVHPSSIASATFAGRYVGDLLGWSACAVGDVNSDGYADFVIASPGWDGTSGAVVLVLGLQQGYSGEFILPFGHQAYVGPQSGEGLGFSVSGDGDFNGDGYDDFLLASPFYNNGTQVVGRTAIILGSSTGAFFSQFITGTIATNGGNVVSVLGDINNDGKDDFIIDNSIFFGRTIAYPTYVSSANLHLDLAPNFTFQSENVAPLGDLNQDGFDDFLINLGAWYGIGLFETYLILGRSSWPSTLIPGLFADWTIREENPGDSNRFRIDSGDVNGDSVPDLLIGMDGIESSGTSKGGVLIFLNE